jgi:O-antigen/teichoic acid export membrane protein
MKERLSTVIRSTFTSIGISCVIFCLIGIGYDVSYSGTFTMEGYAFTRMCVGCMLVGLGFGLPCVVYSSDRMSPLVQSLIHMGIGCVVLTIVGFAAGWLPSDRGIGAAVLSVVIEIGIALVIWVLFYQWEKKKVREMNRKIKEKQK